MDIENIVIFIAIIIIIFILYKCLYQAKQYEGIGGVVKTVGSTFKKGVDSIGKAGKDAVDGGSDILAQIRDLTSKVNDLFGDVDNIFNELKKLEELPSLIEDGFKNVERIPQLIDDLVNQVKNNINIVDKLIDPLEDILNEIDKTIMNSIAELTDNINFALSEIGSLKDIFQKFGKSIADIFIAIFEIVLKILYFIGRLPECLMWYMIDAWENLMNLMVPKWAKDVWNFFKTFIFIPILTVISWFLSLLGYNFKINNSKCYSLNIKDEERKLERAFISIGNLFR